MDAPNSVAYIKFLNLAKAIRELNEFPVLNPMEESLLNFVALAWHANKKSACPKPCIRQLICHPVRCIGI